MKVLLVVTNHDQLGNTGKKTGWYLPEVAHPYYVFKTAGHDIMFVSPNGGKAPMDPGSYESSKDDPVCKNLLEDKNIMSQLDNTKSPSQVNASDFKVIFYAGGHGPMFDLPECATLGKLGAQIYQSGGIVSAVCHGTVGLIPIQLANGDCILKGQTVTSFTDAEEDAVNLTEAMPFPLETRLKECGAKFVGGANFASNVQAAFARQDYCYVTSGYKYFLSYANCTNATGGAGHVYPFREHLVSSLIFNDFQTIHITFIAIIYVPKKSELQ